ncbi:MAG: ornithine cyclodeaminase family protein [Candidatus Ranarchaeia archaeon]|jgi:ornithine cyclodeaminase/alanine dehydrogenase-like protein (mu-crystallin family)
MVLLLPESDLKKHIKIDTVINALEKGFKDLSSGGYDIPPRRLVSAASHNGRYVYIQAYLPQLGVIGSKSFSIYLENPKRNLPTNYYYYMLNDADTGELLAISHGTHLTDLRTAGTPMVASKYLANKEATQAAVFGAGLVAEYQVWALGVYFPRLERINIFDPNINLAQSVKKKWEGKIQPEIVIAKSPKQAVTDSQIINTATSSIKPVFDAKDIQPGTHINAVGAITPKSREIPSEIVVKSKIVIVSKTLLQEAGDILIPIKEGKIKEDAIYAELYEIVSGMKPGRETKDEITLFKSIGYGLEDVVTMKLAYDVAKEKGFGINLEMK